MNIINEDKNCGKIFGDIQIISERRENEYYCKYKVSKNEYKLVLMMYKDILKLKEPSKFVKSIRIKNPYWHLDNGTTIIFTNNLDEILIDTEDFDKVIKYTFGISGGISNIKYAFNSNNNILIHRLICGLTEIDDTVVDHINRNTLDNRKRNLRVTEKCNNNINKESHIGKQLGINYCDKCKRYKAELIYKGKQVLNRHTKRYEEALRLRLEAEEKYFREFMPENNKKMLLEIRKKENYSVINMKKHCGEIHDNIQILNNIDKNKYYCRIKLDVGKYCIAILTYNDILENNYTNKIVKKLNKIPYLHTDKGYTILFTIKGEEIIIDTSDFDKITGNNLSIHKDIVLHYGCSIDSIKNILLDIDEDEYITYKNGIYTDNRRENLCIKKIDTSVFNGIKNIFGIRHINNKYYLKIRLNDMNKHLGVFNTFEEAKEARLRAELKYFCKIRSK